MFKKGDIIKQVTRPSTGCDDYDHGDTILRVVDVTKNGAGMTVEYVSGPRPGPGIKMCGMATSRYKLVQDVTEYTTNQIKQSGLLPEPIPGGFTLCDDGEYVSGQATGMKFDKGKLLFSALTRGLALPIRAVVAVLTYGAQKYAEDSWQDVPNGKRRYENALDRHLNAWKAGEEYDQESGLHHLAHVACNVLFVLWFVIKDTEDQDDHFTFNDPPGK